MKLSMKLGSMVFVLVACAGLVSFALAQPKAPPQADAGVAAGWCMHGAQECPMHKLAELAQVKVEPTKGGAILHITANDASKVSEVQALAQKIGEYMKAGSCPMMHGHEGEGHGHHAHGKGMK
jgi:hypothetical protein